MSGAILKCSVELVDGQCPDGFSVWSMPEQSPTISEILWNVPDGVAFNDVLQAGVSGLLVPAVALVFIAYVCRKVSEAI